MSVDIRIRRRAAGGAVGAPSSLKTAELAWNQQDGKFYGGFGDNGSGVATSIKAFAKDDFVANIPAGGSTGQLLAKNSNADGDLEWIDAAEGGTAYTASGNGIELSGSEFSLNYSEIATGISLSLKAPLASPAFTGTPTGPTAATSTNTTQLATTAFVQSRINELLAGAGAAYDSFAELQALLEGDAASIGAITTSLSGKLTATSNLSDLNDIATARTNLGLGTMATQNKTAVDIDGGTIDGVTLDGGTF